MLHATTLCGFGGGGQSQAPTLMQVLQQLSLTTNLKVCLDAGDFASYPGSGQKLLDRSGNGEDFFLGDDANVEANDPAFTGAAGSTLPPAYFLFDGTGFFRYDTTNPAWVETLHKDNAVFTIIAFCTGAFSIFGTSGVTATDVGIFFDLSVAASAPHLVVLDGSGAAALSVTGDTALNAATPHMVGVSVTEATGAGGGFFYSDGAYNQVSASDTFNSAYTTPSAASATFTAEIGALGNDVAESASGQQFHGIAIWQGTALSKANFDSIWALMRPRLGI